MTAPRLRLLVDPPLAGARNMAVDDALMATAREGVITLRLYRWEPGCLSFGRNQTARGRYDGARATELGFDVVRRPTGGRSVLHHRELTYSLTAPAAWGSLRDVYLRINRSLAAGLRRLAVPAHVHEATGGPAPRPTVRACFRDPLPGEVTAGGRKLVGSAQWRESGALLQHGSILLHNDQAIVERLRIGAAPSGDVPAVGVAELLGSEPDPDALIDAIAEGFREVLGVSVVRGTMTEREEDLAAGRVGRYEDPAWTWRR